MHSIFKFCIQPTFDEFGGIVLVPEGKILLIDEQHGKLHAWIEVSSRSSQQLIILPTGFNVKGNYTHVGSVQTKGSFVWHVYRVAGIV